MNILRDFAIALIVTVLACVLARKYWWTKLPGQPHPKDAGVQRLFDDDKGSN